jgi:predicted ATPase
LPQRNKKDRLLAHDKEAAVVHGLGGVGKTQLADEYAHRYARHYAFDTA